MSRAIPVKTSPVPQLQLADGQVHRESAAVLAAAHHLAADADDLPLSRRQVIGQIAVVLTLIRRGHQHLHVVAHHLVAGVPEQPLGRRVHRFDGPLFVDGEDGVDRRVEDGAGAALALLQAAHGGAEVGDVAGDAREHRAVA